MKKIIVIILSLFIITGCDMMDNKAKSSVQEYLDNYKELDSNVKKQLESVINQENFNEEQRELYRDIMERQYKNLEYEITNEKYDGNKATITAKVTVYDYYKAQESIADYLKNNREEFYKDGQYDENSYINYKLNTMKNYKDRVTYSIDFKLDKKDNNWVIKDLDLDDIEKIHGIYDYSQE